MHAFKTKPEGCGQSKIIEEVCNGDNQGWEAVGQNVCSHWPLGEISGDLLSAQISSRASHAQTHTGNAGRFYQRGLSDLKFGHDPFLM